MTKLEKIEKDIASPNHDELTKFADRFVAHHDAFWDRQIEADANSGRLSRLIRKAKAEIATGISRHL